MELDDLKKSWNVLDKQLQKETIVDEKQIAELIAKYQNNASKGLNEVTRFQKKSLIIAIPLILLMVFIILYDTAFLSNLKITAKVVSMFIYAILTLIFGFWWDLKTYRFSRNTKIAEMSTVEAMERMDTFRKWMSVEFKIIPIWSIGFFALYYWLRDYHTQPLMTQVVFAIFSAITIVGIMLFVHKKLFKHLNEVKKNLDEIKELESEN